MLEGFIPSRKNVLLVVLTLCAFFIGAQATLAGSVFPAEGPPAGFTPPGGGTQTGGPYNGPGPVPNNSVGGGTGNNGGTNNPPGGVDAIGEAAGVDTSVQTPPPEEPPIQVSSSGCWGSPEGFINCLVVSFFGSIAAVAGYTFDASISMFIVGFGDLYLTAGIGSTVERVWTTVRDVFNLTFIFGLVYIGFQIILGTNESSAKRTLPLLILAALLVNFSLFVVKFIVDFANLAAIQIFNLFTANNQVGDQGTPSGGIVDVLANADGSSLSLAFLNTIGISGLLNNSMAMDGTGSGIMYMFTMVIIFSVITYVFFAGAILITIRFAALVFYMIFSPVMFLGWVFPGFKSYSDKFWQGLFGQAFFAPALLFMLYITYQLAQGFNDGQRMGGEGIQADPENITAFAQFMPYLVMIVIFIVASLVVARKMADTGGSMVMKANDWGIGKLNKALKGGGGVLAGGVGQYGYKRIDKMANSDNRALRTVGRLATFSGVRDKAEKAYKSSAQGQWKENREKKSTEMAVRKSQSDLSKTLKLNPKTTSDQIAFEQAVTDASTSQIIKELEKYTPESGEYQRIVKALSPSQVSKVFDAKDDEFSPTQKSQFAGVRANMVKQRLTSAPIGSTGANGPDLRLAIERDASADDLKHLGLDTLRSNAAFISSSKMDDLKSKLSPTEWGILNSDRKKMLENIFEKTPEKVFETFDGKRKKDKEIAKLPGTILNKPDAAQFMNSNVLNSILNEDALNASDREKIIKNIYALGAGHPISTNVHEWLTKTPAGRSFVTTV